MEKFEYGTRDTFYLPMLPCSHTWPASLNSEIKPSDLLNALNNRPEGVCVISQEAYEHWRPPTWEHDSLKDRMEKAGSDTITHWQWLDEKENPIGISTISSAASQVTFHVMAHTADSCHKIATALDEWYLKNGFEPKAPEEEEDTVNVTFWNLTRNGPCNRSKLLKCPKLKEVANNYPKTVADGLNWTAHHPDPIATGKLIFWMGIPGTGKTWSIRALMREWRDTACFHLITDPEVFFNDTEYLQVVLDNARDDKLNLIIIEDSPRVVLQEARGTHETHAMSRLLNLTDGLWGEAKKAIFLMTTNDNIGDIDPAFLRDGRLLQRLSFRGFNQEEAQEWLAERNVTDNIPEEELERGDVPLCRLYGILRNAEGSRIKTEEKGPMGFKTTGILTKTRTPSMDGVPSIGTVPSRGQ